MRLSDVLSRAPDRTEMQVERFLLSARRLGWGRHTVISVGKVTHNFLCFACGDMRTYLSGDKLSCLAVGETLVSIDTSLKCSACNSTVEAWFLVEAMDDFYSPAPTVRIDRYTESLHGLADRVDTSGGPFADLVKRADLAYEAGFGAGSMVYLRKIFEMITVEVAEISGITISTGASGQVVNFRGLLQRVDEQRNIIPRRFSSNGYQLFSELSDVIHGRTDEDDALRKFKPCRDLVLGVVEEVNRDNEFARAIEELGWASEDIAKITGEAVAP